MSLTEKERTTLNKIAENSAATRQLLIVHTGQIETLFKQQNIHSDKITTVEIRQSECGAKKAFDAGSLPGSASDRKSNTLQFVAIMVALIGSPVVTALVTYFLTRP